MDLPFLENAAKRAVQVARHFGNRCNSDSTLTARECTETVKALLNAGNSLEQYVKELRGGAEPGELPPRVRDLLLEVRNYMCEDTCGLPANLRIVFELEAELKKLLCPAMQPAQVPV